jgi:hypothetical protein
MLMVGYRAVMRCQFRDGPYVRHRLETLVIETRLEQEPG